MPSSRLPQLWRLGPRILQPTRIEAAKGRGPAVEPAGRAVTREAVTGVRVGRFTVPTKVPGRRRFQFSLFVLSHPVAG